MNKGLKRLLATVLVCLLVVGIRQTSSNKVFADTIRPATTEVTHSCYTSSGGFEVYCTSSWQAVATASFIRLTGNNYGNGNGYISYQLCTNPSSSERTGTILLYNSSGMVNVTIRQRAFEDESAIILRDNPSGTYSKTANTATVSFYAVDQWYIENNSNFVTASRTSGYGQPEYQTVTLSISANNTPFQRTASIVIHSTNFNCSRTITIVQSPGPTVIIDSISNTVFNSSGGTATIRFRAGESWYINCPSFASVSQSSGNAGTHTITLYVATNTSYSVKSGNVVIICSSGSDHKFIQLLGKE